VAVISGNEVVNREETMDRIFRHPDSILRLHSLSLPRLLRQRRIDTGSQLKHIENTRMKTLWYHNWVSASSIPLQEPSPLVLVSSRRKLDPLSFAWSR
jgi:hypothetical protein